MRSLLVSAGEASGDRAAAGVVKALDGMGSPRVEVFGLGGAGLAELGVELVADARETAVVGVQAVLGRAPTVLQAFGRLALLARRRKPSVALLVNYTEFNLRLGRWLRSLGVPVLWYGAPQTWAWRPGRVRALAKAQDALAVFFPFEVDHFRRAGIDARYVGHPALEVIAPRRDLLRQALDLPHRAPAVAICPGSRDSEVRALLVRFLDAYARVRKRVAALDGRVLVSQGLTAEAKRFVLRIARAHGVSPLEVPPGDGAARWLHAFDASLVASGTASLEAALAGAVPVIAYRVSRVAGLVLRGFLHVEHIGLPNLVLGERAFPELIQGDVTAFKLAAALRQVLDRHDRAVAACDLVRSRFGDARPSQTVAEMLQTMAVG